MKPRHKAQMRLARTVPGERNAEVRPVVQRLQDRVVEAVPPRSTIGDQVRVPDRHRAPKRASTIEAAPNAPQLKRLVRHPYAMTPEPTRRVQLIPEAHARESVKERETVQKVLMVHRKRAAIGPVPKIERAVAPAHPFVRRRAALEEEEDLLWR